MVISHMVGLQFFPSAKYLGESQVYPYGHRPQENHI